MPAGARQRRATELLASRQMSTLMRELATRDPELMGKKISQNALLADQTMASLPTSSVSRDPPVVGV